MKKSKERGELTVLEHLKALKRTLLILGVLLTLSFGVAYFFTPQLMTFVLEKAGECAFVYLAPQEVLLQQIKMALLLALIASSPLSIPVVLSFVFPALTKKWVCALLLTVFTGLLLWLGGAYFAFEVVVPFTFQFLRKAGDALGIVESITVSSYLGLLESTMITLGCVAEMPILTTLLTRAGVLTYAGLKKGRSFAIVLIFVVAAIITPPDVISQFMVAIPMLFLFEISMVCSRLFRRR